MGLPKYKRTPWHDDALLCFSDLLLCKIFARWVYQNTNARNDMTMRCFVVGSMRLYLGKIFARWVYQNTNARNDTTMRCLLSARCVCIGVKYLQDGFTLRWLKVRLFCSQQWTLRGLKRWRVFGTITAGPGRLHQNVLISLPKLVGDSFKFNTELPTTSKLRHFF